MQGASTFAILVLFMLAQPWVSTAELIQRCVLHKHGVEEGSGPDDQDVISMDQGSDLRIYIPGIEKGVIGSYLLFCDDQIDDVVIELAEDKQSYLVHRPTNSGQNSLYWLKLILEPEPMRRPYRQQQRPQQSRRLRYY